MDLEGWRDCGDGSNCLSRKRAVLISTYYLDGKLSCLKGKESGLLSLLWAREAWRGRWGFLAYGARRAGGGGSGEEAQELSFHPRPPSAL